MIAALLLVLQVFAATPTRPTTPTALTAPTILFVRHGEREATVPLVPTSAGLALRAELLAPALPTSVRRLPNGRHALSLAGVELGLIEQVPFASIGEAIVPLTGAPFVRGGSLFVPLQIVSEILPRFASGIVYDPGRSELRTLATRPRTGAATASQPLPGGGPAVSSSTSASNGARARTAAETRKRVVVVDAGHGGTDPGTSGPAGPGAKLLEKDIALQVARRLRQALETRGLDVVMTRDRDTLIALGDRGRIANQRHGDLFISIHVNAPSPRWKNPERVRGFETYFLAEAKTEDERRVAEMENEAIRFETGAQADDDDPLSFIIKDMAQNEHLRESSDLADKIQRHLGRKHPGPSRGVKQAGFRVLMTAYMPAVLVELGFASNRDEANYMQSAAGQRDLAEAIAEAAVAYLQDYERRVGTTASP